MGQKPNWTKEEKDYLEDAWGRVSISGIAKKLNRSVEAVKLKAQKSGLSRHLHADDKPTLEQVWEALGIKGSTGYNTKRFIALGLPIHKHKVVKCSFRTVDLKEFWTWAEQHQRLLNFRNFEENALGEEPDWVKRKRVEDVRNFLKPHNCQWTPEEDDLLKKLLKMYKYTYAGLSKRFNRSEGAIKRHIHDLKLLERPLRVESRLWSDDEVLKLLELWEKGYSYERIADLLGRTALQVRGKHERLRDPGLTSRSQKRYREKQLALKTQNA